VISLDDVFDGKIIKQLRKQKKLRQNELAKLAGISNTYLSDIEVGRTNPSLKTLISIARVLEVDINILISKNS
jgi:transcriptional regulator with XRE-family HTH domain